MPVKKITVKRGAGLKQNFEALHGRSLSEMAGEMSKITLPDGSIEIGERTDGGTKQIAGQQSADNGPENDGAGAAQSASADEVPQL